MSDILRGLQMVLNRIKENEFNGTFEAFKKWCDHCILSQRVYFEGDGSQSWVKLNQHFLFNLVRELSDRTLYMQEWKVEQKIVLVFK
jgi:hypothetical protein